MFPFGMSWEGKEFVKNFGISRKKRCWFPQQRTCHTQWRLDLVGKPPLVHPSCRYIAGRVTTREGFCPPFEYFGFLFPNKVVFGARYGYVRYIENIFFESRQESMPLAE